MKLDANVSKMKWLFCGIALVAALVTSAGQGKNTSVSDGFMVRAILLEQGEGGYTVAALYQDPQAAANSAEVQAPFLLTQGQGDSLAAAFAALQQALAAPVSYQRSDYTLLCGQPNKNLLAEYAALVQSMGCGRYAAQVCYCAQGVAALAQQAEQTQTLAEDLLALLEQSKQLPAKLFDAAQAGLVVPQVEQAGGKFSPLQTSYLLDAAEGVPYSDTQTQLHRLLGGNWGTCDFVMGDIAFSVGARAHSRSGVLAGVSDQSPDFPTLHLYGVVQSTSDDSRLALRKMELYLEGLAASQPALLAQLGISEVQVSLFYLQVS